MDTAIRPMPGPGIPEPRPCPPCTIRARVSMQKPEDMHNFAEAYARLLG